MIVLASALAWGQDVPPAPTITSPVTWELFFSTSDKQHTFAWDAVANATEYECLFYNLERNNWVARGRVTHPTNQITVRFPVGHYVFFARAVGDSNGEAVYSDWCNSSDIECVESKPWWVYTYLAPPGQIE